MKQTGKILFFNADTGQGMIMTSDKKKSTFSVADWDDFDTMPSLGLEIRFTSLDNVASEIVSLNYVEEEDIPEEDNTPTETEKTEEEPAQTLKDEELENTTENTEEDVAHQAEENTSEESQEESLTEDATDAELEKHVSQEMSEEEALEHFENNPEIMTLDNMDELQDEIGEREESVTVTLNLSIAVNNYFDIINQNIEKRTAYRKVQGSLDYLVIRRFLWTTFNNLSEIDLHIITPKIKAISDDLRAMATVYNDFVRKTNYPPLAYEEVFLSCQAEYMKIRECAEKTIQRLNQLKGSEKYVGSALKVKKNELSSEIDSEEFDLLQGELKSLNGAYVDIVHMMAELDERYKHDMKLLTDFEQEYREDFYDLFNTSAKKYKKSIVDILSAQAFLLDTKLWGEAKKSKAVKVHFHKANITGEFNTRTYLKYYLDSQDTEKLSDESEKLGRLYDYLISQEKENIMIVLSDANDAMEFEAAINRADKSFCAKAFIDEKRSLKWAIKNSVKVLVLETQLSKISIETYLSYYQQYVLVIPKIILLGASKRSGNYAIHKLLPRGISPQVMAKNVKEFFATPEEKN